ncbi:MAG: phosphonopyruvate decarboxylase [Ichthyobacteriaceae bacterium]|nr:phosphonopyruvate decarboxylase [Ichthyobacteriaceae bacterium]
MISTKLFFQELLNNKIEFFAGVPDSLLKDICSYIDDNTSKDKHIISANEGSAIGLAVGNYLATGNVPMVYMQNSGLGNAINPILSIADEEVYGIPMVLMIGWRGETKDEPQHVKQGKVTKQLLDAVDVSYQILDNTSNYKKVIEKAKLNAVEQGKPVAILVRKGAFESYKSVKNNADDFELSREDAIEVVLNNIADGIVVSTTGKTSREVFELREAMGQGHEKDFLTVGGMGHTSQIALGVALGAENKNVFCLDGDGSVIMHMGSLAVSGSLPMVKNFKHILLNNQVHDSVGGQATVASTLNFCGVAKASNYSYTVSVNTKKELEIALQDLIFHKGIAFLEIMVNQGSRANLGRPTTSTKENKESFQNFVQQK